MPVLNPPIDFAERLQRIVIPNQVFPLQRRGDTLGRETDVVVRFVFPVKQDTAQKLFRNP